MALADAVRNRRPGGMPCSIGNLLKVLPETEADALNAMLGTPDNWGWSATEIWDALRAEGYEVGQQTINRHRGKKCRCWA